MTVRGACECIGSVTALHNFRKHYKGVFSRGMRWENGDSNNTQLKASKKRNYKVNRGWEDQDRSNETRKIEYGVNNKKKIVECAFRF